MILGLSVSTFTLVHVVISLIGIGSGLIVLYGMVTSHKPGAWTGLFLATTVLTSATGFLFDSPFGPARVVGIISLVLLAIALLALYGQHLAGVWRPVYVVTALMALYLNCLVGVTQAFQKLDFLRPLAPTQSEPPFLIAQGALLLLFVVIGLVALRGYHPERAAAA